MFCKIYLFCSENAIPGIPKSRTDVSIFVQFSVNMSYVQLNIRMCFHQTFYALRSSNDSHKLDMLAAVLLDKINSLQLVAELADYQLRNYENLLQPETYALLNRHPASKALAI